MTSTPRPGTAPATAAVIEPALLDRLRALARVPVLLVASDYDGTVAPIVANPAEARPDRDAVVAVRSLAAMPSTHAALISGRALSDLARLSGEPERVHLVGSHGSEFDPDFATSLPDHATELRSRVEAELSQIASATPGCEVEVKPASVAFHYRNADAAAAEEAIERVKSGPAKLDGVYTKLGKMVIELAVVSTNKGAALEVIRRRVGASAVIFLGDDVTDEDGFRTLAGPDVGVKVGEHGETAAEFRVAGTREVARVLATLCELRGEWLAGSAVVAIERHGMLTDQRTAALVTPEGRVAWFCAPRIDSPSVFAELVGGPSAGYFSVAPAGGERPLGQRYDGDTFTLITEWPGFSVSDYLDCSGGRVRQRAGRTDLVRVIEGSGRVRVEYAPRLDYGRETTRLEPVDGMIVVQDTLDPITLCAPGVEWEIREDAGNHTAVAEIDLDALGGRCVLDLRYGAAAKDAGTIDEPRRRAQTERHWLNWVEDLEIPPGVDELGIDGLGDLVRRSALVLRGLCHGPTGAIAAAATTSLPESIGGIRNWDYRYCWPRDAALAASALVRLGSTTEAIALLDWLLGVVQSCVSPDRLSPIYTVSGTELPPEAEIAELAGYAGSRPVRVGNAACRQLQLDVFGPIVELINLLLLSGAPLSSEHWRLVEAMVQAVETRWEEPDHGIWEIRGPPRHHLHSKVMCWQCARLGARIAERFSGRPRPAWDDLAAAIRADIEKRGWHPERDAFSGAYEIADPDASILHVGLTGMIPGDDPRLAATVAAVERDLRTADTVYRYHTDDHLPGAEGGFNICTTWLIECLDLVGRREEAIALLAAYTRCAGPTGLLAEEIDPQTGHGLGNFPQAYSHLGLINAALRLANGTDAQPFVRG